MFNFSSPGLPHHIIDTYLCSVLEEKAIATIYLSQLSLMMSAKRVSEHFSSKEMLGLPTLGWTGATNPEVKQRRLHLPTWSWKKTSKHPLLHKAASAEIPPGWTKTQAGIAGDACDVLSRMGKKWEFQDLSLPSACTKPQFCWFQTTGKLRYQCILNRSSKIMNCSTYKRDPTTWFSSSHSNEWMLKHE